MALTTALCETGRDLILRRLLAGGAVSSRLVMGAGCVVSAVLAAPLALGLSGSLNLQALLVSLLVTAIVNGLAFWAYGRAIALSELSEVMPLINLSTVVLLGSGWLFLSERPTPMAVAGVICLVAGALLLGGGSGPALWRQKGSRWMLLVALLWGIGASIDKLGVRAAGSVVWVACFNLVVGLPLVLPALAEGEAETLRGGEGRWVAVTMIGVLGALGMTLQMEALTQTSVVNVIAIKRLSTLFSALAGLIWLGERQAALRVPAAALMLVGAALVLRFGAG